MTVEALGTRDLRPSLTLSTVMTMEPLQVLSDRISLVRSLKVNTL